MAKRAGKRADFVIHIAGERSIKIHGTPHEVAKKAARHARGTFDRSKSAYDQPYDAAPGQPVTVRDAEGRMVMHCSPALYSRSKRAARHTFARCEISPGFLPAKRKRRRRG